MRILLTLFILIVFYTSCTFPKPIYTQPTDNNIDYKISYLFEHDGCKVYRFEDRSKYVYFTSCRGETSYVKDSVNIIRNSTNQK